ncbi:MAG TPA: glucose-6-phosphate dehydrogenase [Acidimicrobiia bacterium]|nr:glucose-6-phosphate dehydrogenase [Acidimicrobiia bacterium]
MMTEVDRHVFVIFGGTGDLARRKLIPSLYRLITENGIAGRCVLLGVASSDLDDDAYRTWTREALADSGLDDVDLEAWCDENVHYQQLGREAGAYDDLRHRIEAIEADHDLPGNRAFYLALPPPVFPIAITGLAEASLNRSPGWTRLVIEKPIGTDLESAQALNGVIHEFFEESQVYRIDHYLGKETVQNLLSFRFSNPMFESVWNRDRVESVEITVAEDLGIGSRAGYYETAGALRDMVQNHLTQVLALVAMEPPISFDADQIRTEKVKVVEAIAPIRRENVVFGQYGAGTVGGVAVPGYREEDGVAADSKTPTFVSLELEVDTWRWRGVPFYLRTGKRLPKFLTQIAVTFQRPPLCIFHGHRDACVVHPNVLLITLQPDEGFMLQFNVKVPGEAMMLDTQELRFSHANVYGRLPDAYQTLILDVIEGDQTLFVRADEVDASWRLYDPLLDYQPEPYTYEAGTWGPAVSNHSLALGGKALTGDDVLE